MNMILASIGVFLVVVILLVVILLVAKNFLVPSGNVKLTINGDKELDVASGSTLLNTLSVNGVFLSSACGGKGSCGQCKCQVLEGGGEILPSETPHFSRKQIQDHWRLGCQVKVKGDMAIKVPESVLGVKEWECEVISNKNVATFIKEFIVALPKGEHMDFVNIFTILRFTIYDLPYAPIMPFRHEAYRALHVRCAALPPWKNIRIRRERSLRELLRRCPEPPYGRCHLQ